MKCGTTEEHNKARSKHVLESAGYKSGGDIAQDVPVHTKELHKSVKRTNAKAGLRVTGENASHHLGKRSRGGKPEHWIQGTHLKEGAFTAQAKKAGKSVHSFAEEHKHDSGKTGNRARLALTFQKMAKKK